MSNRELSTVLDFISGVLALKGEDRFRVRAYQNAAAAVDQHPEQLWELFRTHQNLDDVPAIGRTLVEKLTELFTTGNIVAFQKYVHDIPAGVWALTPVHGIGVKRAYKLATTFHLDKEETALSELIAKAQAGEIRNLEGFGEKSEQELLEALQNHVVRDRIHRSVAAPIAHQLITELLKSPAIQKAEALGSLRRETPTVGDIDIGIATNNIGSVKTFVKNMKSVKRVIIEGDQVLRVMLTNDHQVDIKASPLEAWGSFLQHYTGSKEHNIKLREFALRQGKSLSEHGIKETDEQGFSILKKFTSEEAFYAHLGLDWIKPQDRVGSDEIERAKIKIKNKVGS